jgi:hypothetical protein
MLRPGDLDQQVEQCAFVRIDDRDALAVRFLLDPGEHPIALGHEPVQIGLKLVADLHRPHRPSSTNCSNIGCSATTYSLTKPTACSRTAESRRGAAIVS